MDARTERTIYSAGGATSIHRRPGALRASDSLGAGQPLVRHRGPPRTASQASGATLVVLRVHEGLRNGRGRARSLAAFAAGISVAPALRAPLDELRPGHRTDLSRR